VLFDRDRVLRDRVVTEPVERRAEWAFLAWFALGNVTKYLSRGSVWEALAALEQARSEFLRLYAANMGVANPELGITSILDTATGDVPPQLADAYPRPEPAEIRRAARVVAELLTAAWERTPFAQWVEAEL
jgi:hypothetical protein